MGALLAGTTDLSIPTCALHASFPWFLIEHGQNGGYLVDVSPVHIHPTFPHPGWRLDCDCSSMKIKNGMEPAAASIFPSTPSAVLLLRYSMQFALEIQRMTDIEQNGPPECFGALGRTSRNTETIAGFNLSLRSNERVSHTALNKPGEVKLIHSCIKSAGQPTDPSPPYPAKPRHRRRASQRPLFHPRSSSLYNVLPSSSHQHRYPHRPPQDVCTSVLNFITNTLGEESHGFKK